MSRIPRNPNAPAPADTQPPLRWRGVGITLLVVLLYAIVAELWTQSGQLTADAARPVAAVWATRTPTAAPLVGVAAPRPSDDQQVRAAVERANAAFITAHAQADPTELRYVATGEWLDQQAAEIAALRASGRREHWRLLALELRVLSLHGDQASVCTAERWEYQAIDSDGSSSNTTSFVERYTLLRRASGWLVKQIEYGDEVC